MHPRRSPPTTTPPLSLAVRRPPRCQNDSEATPCPSTYTTHHPGNMQPCTRPQITPAMLPQPPPLTPRVRLQPRTPPPRLASAPLHVAINDPGLYFLHPSAPRSRTRPPTAAATFTQYRDTPMAESSTSLDLRITSCQRGIIYSVLCPECARFVMLIVPPH